MRRQPIRWPIQSDRKDTSHSRISSSVEYRLHEGAIPFYVEDWEGGICRGSVQVGFPLVSTGLGLRPKYRFPNPADLRTRTRAVRGSHRPSTAIERTSDPTPDSNTLSTAAQRSPLSVSIEQRRIVAPKPQRTEPVWSAHHVQPCTPTTPTTPFASSRSRLMRVGYFRIYRGMKPIVASRKFAIIDIVDDFVSACAAKRFRSWILSTIESASRNHRSRVRRQASAVRRARGVAIGRRPKSSRVAAPRSRVSIGQFASNLRQNVVQIAPDERLKTLPIKSEKHLPLSTWHVLCGLHSRCSMVRHGESPVCGVPRSPRGRPPYHYYPSGRSNEPSPIAVCIGSSRWRRPRCEQHARLCDRGRSMCRHQSNFGRVLHGRLERTNEGPSDCVVDDVG